MSDQNPDLDRSGRARHATRCRALLERAADGRRHRPGLRAGGALPRRSRPVDQACARGPRRCDRRLREPRCRRTDEHPAMAEVAVDPTRAWRRYRYGAGARAALAEGGAGARVWAHGDLPAARALADAPRSEHRPRAVADASIAGYPGAARTRGPRRPHPADLRGPVDDPEILRVNNAAFAWHPEQGGWTEREIAARRAESWFDPAGLFLAFDAADPSRLLGFHWTKVAPGDGRTRRSARCTWSGSTRPRKGVASADC